LTTATGFIEEIAFRHIGETDCVTGVVGFELRCAERKFIFDTSRGFGFKGLGGDGCGPKAE
jgi:hypothetical protein